MWKMLFYNMSGFSMLFFCKILCTVEKIVIFFDKNPMKLYLRLQNEK